MRILLATDAWYPQVNGVVRCLDRLRQEAAALGATIEILSHEGYTTVPLPTYSEIRIAITAPGAISRRSRDPLSIWCWADSFRRSALR